MEKKEIICYDNSIAKTLADVQIEELASGFQFTEGPVWHPEQNLLFSDIPANKIWQLSRDNETLVYLDNSGCTHDDTVDLHEQIGSNGLAFDTNGDLLICQHGNHAIARLDKKGQLHTVVATYNGKPLNSPNDIVVHSAGGIYFTDPPYGLKDQVLNPAKYQSFAGVYRYYDDELVLLRDHLRYPNGVCFSPNEDYLYVSTNHPDEPVLWRYRLSATGEIKDESVLIEQNADGITTDKTGNLWLSTDDGVMIVSSSGSKLALIPLPDSPANITWGGNNNSELLVTARSYIFKISGIKI